MPPKNIWTLKMALIKYKISNQGASENKTAKAFLNFSYLSHLFCIKPTSVLFVIFDSQKVSKES